MSQPEAQRPFLSRVPLHPALLWAWPCAMLFGANAHIVGASEAMGPVALCALAGLVVWGLAFAALRDARRAAVLASCAAAIFGYRLAFGVVSDTFAWLELRGVGSFPSTKVRFAVTVAALAGGSLTAAWLLLRRRAALDVQTLVFNAMGLTTVTMALVPALFGGAPPAPKGAAAQAVAYQPGKTLPDVVVVLLDGYGRADALKRSYGYDNGPFVQALEARGFFVAKDARANYLTTDAAITSMLHMNYVETFVTPEEQATQRLMVLQRHRAQNPVVATFAALGHRFVSFRTADHRVDLAGADERVVGEELGLPLGHFDWMVIDSTPLGVLLRRLRPGDRFKAHRSWIVQALEELPKLLAKRDGKRRFVFAHVTAPHPPFVFDEQGKAVRSKRGFFLNDGNQLFRTEALLGEYKGMYPRQLQHINTLVLQAVDRMVANAEQPPIIVLISDHGPRATVHWEEQDKTCFAEAGGTLFAAHVPGLDAQAAFTDTISLVNLFRVLFRAQLGADIERIPDLTHYTPYKAPFSTTVVQPNPDSPACKAWFAIPPLRFGPDRGLVPAGPVPPPTYPSPPGR